MDSIFSWVEPTTCSSAAEKTSIRARSRSCSSGMPPWLQAIVVPAPDDIKGQIPVAFIVPRSAAAASAEDIKQYTLREGPAFAHPPIHRIHGESAGLRYSQDRSLLADRGSRAHRARRGSQHVNAFLDHIIWACDDLERGSRRFEALTGVSPRYGGVHASGFDS